jgi:hypothetical protein
LRAYKKYQKNLKNTLSNPAPMMPSVFKILSCNLQYGNHKYNTSNS